MPRFRKVFKKRVFHGNKFVASPSKLREHSCDLSPNFQEESSGKLLLSSSFSEVQILNYIKKDSANDWEYDIVNLNKLNDLVNNIAVCKFCHCALKLERKSLAGLACEITLHCDNCNQKVVSPNCEIIKSTVNDEEKTFYDLNLRLVYVLRVIGKGRAAGEKLCSAMNFSPLVHLFHIHSKYLVSVRTCMQGFYAKFY